MARNTTVLEMVRASLKTNGYDGLFNTELECGCEVGDLEPCGEMSSDCEAGYKREGCDEDCGEGCDWHIWRHKESRDA